MGRSLAASWAVQRRIIAALLMREILTRFGRHNIGFLWLFVEPMMFTIGVTTLWTLTKAIHSSSLPIAAFAITGYSSVLLWRNMPARCIFAIQPNLALMYHRNVKVIDIFVSRIVLEAAGATASFILLSLLFYAVGWVNLPEDLLKVIGGWCVLAWFGAALALFLGALSEMSELVEKIWHPMAYLTFPLSGAAFQVASLPEGMRKFMLYIPMVNCVEYIREGYFGSQVTAIHDMTYVICVCAVLSLFAMVQVHRIGKLVMPE